MPATIKTEEKQSTWTGDIALLNASDYIYASKNNSCATSAIENSECVNDNWLSNHSTYTLNGRENMLAYLWYTSTSSGLRTIQIGQGYSGNVYPVIHLKTEVKISGEGTEENPYIIQ